MQKPERKTIDPKYCDKHSCFFEESHEYNDGSQAYEWVCPQCEKIKQDNIAFRNKVKKCVSDFVLPKRLQPYTFQTFVESNKNKKMRDICIEYVDNWPQSGGIVMLGGVGTGKTHLAIATCQALCLKGVTCQLTTVNKIVRDIRSVWGKKKFKTDDYGFEEKEITEESIIADYVSIDLLVIDEIGSQYGSESEKIIINEIINNRYEDMKPTIVMGNVSKTELNNILGERVVDRLTHGGNLLFFEWESLRK